MHLIKNKDNLNYNIKNITRGIDYIGVGVGVIIINKDKKIFCHKRGAKAKNEQGKWDMPGGGVEFNEILEDAIVREIIEEHDFI